MNILNDTKFGVNCISELGYLREKLAACTQLSDQDFSGLVLKAMDRDMGQELCDLRVE